MKRFLLLCIVCVIAISGFGQIPEFGGVLRTQVNGNSVLIKLDSTWRDCGVQYDQQVFFNGDSITWLQFDTVIGYACICLYSYSVTLDSLSDGNYTVAVYYSESCWNGTTIYPCDTIYQGSTSFTINNLLTATPVKKGDSTTPCLQEWDHVAEYPKDNLYPYPNPTRDFIAIPLADKYKPVELFDVVGHPVSFKISKKSGKFIVMDLSTLPGGIYYFKTSGKAWKIIKL
jgi:hypothetical protein